MTEGAKVGWAAVYLLATLAWFIFLMVDIFSRWGEPLVLESTTATVIWVVALGLRFIAAIALKAGGVGRGA